MVSNGIFKCACMKGSLLDDFTNVPLSWDHKVRKETQLQFGTASTKFNGDLIPAMLYRAAACCHQKSHHQSLLFIQVASLLAV